MNFNDHIWNMKIAIEQAEQAARCGEVPVGAVLVNDQGKVISQGHNLKEKEKDATLHAEVVVMKEASRLKKDWRLDGHILYCTLEPCPMCLASMVQARIKKLIFATYDPKGGALSLGYDLYKDKRLNHNFEIMGGLLHYQTSSLLSYFFKNRRKGHQHF